MTEWKIEKNIPIPERLHSGGLPKGSGFKGLLKDLEVGDSVFRKGWTSARAAAALYVARKCHGYSYVQRKEGDGVRIWRVS